MQMGRSKTDYYVPFWFQIYFLGNLSGENAYISEKKAI